MTDRDGLQVNSFAIMSIILQLATCSLTMFLHYVNRKNNLGSIKFLLKYVFLLYFIILNLQNINVISRRQDCCKKTISPFVWPYVLKADFSVLLLCVNNSSFQCHFSSIGTGDTPCSSYFHTNAYWHTYT